MSNTDITYNIFVNNPPYLYPFFNIFTEDNSMLDDQIILNSKTTYHFKNNDDANYKINIGTQYGYDISGKCILDTNYSDMITVNPNKTTYLHDKYVVMWTSGNKFMQRPLLLSIDETSSTNDKKHAHLINIDGNFHTIYKKNTTCPIDSDVLTNHSTLHGFNPDLLSHHIQSNCSSNSNNTCESQNVCNSQTNPPPSSNVCSNHCMDYIYLGVDDKHNQPLGEITPDGLALINSALKLDLTTTHINNKLYMILVNNKFTERVFVYNNKYEIYKKNNDKWCRSFTSNLNSCLFVFQELLTMFNVQLSKYSKQFNQYSIELFLFNSKKHVSVHNNLSGYIKSDLFYHLQNNNTQTDTDGDNGYIMYAYINDLVPSVDSDLFSATDTSGSSCIDEYSSQTDLQNNYWSNNNYFILNYSKNNTLFDISDNTPISPSQCL
jgi:hypothetical protein